MRNLQGFTVKYRKTDSKRAVAFILSAIAPFTYVWNTSSDIINDIKRFIKHE